MIQKRSILIILACFFLLSGCNFLPEPTSLIQAPAYVTAEINTEESLKSLVKTHLPKGTELLIPNAPIGTDAIISSDFNGDGQEEIIGLYQSNENKNQVGAFALLKKNESWEKIFAKKGSGYEISWASASDLTGDGIDELLLGWKVGNLAGNLLEIYSWENGGFIPLKKINYHKMEVIQFEDDGMARLAIWKKDVDDSYDIELLKWDRHTFVADVDHYPSYFPKVVQYYKERTNAVPNSALYWYLLADAYLKENHPDLALKAITKGMEYKIVIPSFDKFAELKKTIETRLSNIDKEILYDIPNSALHLGIPKEIAPYIVIDEESGSQLNYTVTVSVSPNAAEKKSLFTIDVYAKDMMMEDPNQIEMESVAETEKYQYYATRNKEDFYSDDPNINNIYEKAFALRDRIIQSITPGTFNPKYSSLEEKMIVEMVSKAVSKYWYVVSGGGSGSTDGGLIKSFPINGLDYRYMGPDLDTKAELLTYLSGSYTSDSVQSYIKRAGIVEHNGKLAQPNADGGSILQYDKATITTSSSNGMVKEVDLKVPLGYSLTSEYVHVEFQKTQDGWRISTEPGTI